MSAWRGSGLNVDLKQLTNKPLPQKTVQINQQKFKVEISETLADNIRGLAGRKSLSAKSGMMFLFGDTNDTNAMNTAKTAMPIDMLFINPDHQITCVVRDAKPFSKQEYQCKGAMGALVINSGEVDKYKLKVGMKVDGI